MIQSGRGKELAANFTLNKFGTESDDKKLEASVIYINICGKFVDMLAMASRVLLINPSET